MPNLWYKLQQYWHARNPREQKLLVMMLSLSLLALVWTVWDSQSAAKARLSLALPQARTQLEEMQNQANELSRLRSLPARQKLDILPLLEALGQMAKVHQVNLTIKENKQQIEIQGESVDFNAWVAWLAEAQTTYGLRVLQMTVTQAEQQRVQAVLAIQP